MLHHVRSTDCLVRPSERGVERLHGLPKPGSYVFVTMSLSIIDSGELLAIRTRRGLWNPWLSTFSCGLGKNEIDTAGPIAIRTACLRFAYKLQLRGNRTYHDCGHNVWRSVQIHGSSRSVSDLGDIGIGGQPFDPGTSLVVEVVAVAKSVVGVVLVVATLVVGGVAVWVLATLDLVERGSGVLSAP